MPTLRDPFDNVLRREGKFDYVPWSSIADRLDEAAPGWSFAIMQIGPDWVHGRLTIGDTFFENIGYAENAEADWAKEVLKHAATDSFKRCAALAGVARYLYDKDAGVNGAPRPAARPTAPTPIRPVAAPQRSSTAVPDMPEFPDDWGDPVLVGERDGRIPPVAVVSPGFQATTLQPNKGEGCPVHPGEVWRGDPGDLYHKLPSGSGYCRPEGQPKKARAR